MKKITESIYEIIELHNKFYAGGNLQKIHDDITVKSILSIIKDQNSYVIGEDSTHTGVHEVINDCKKTQRKRSEESL